MSKKKQGGPKDGPGGRQPKDGSGSSAGLSRRRFLSMSVLAGCTALGVTGRAQAAPEFKGWPGSYGVLTDLTACVGCRSCEKACNEANRMPAADRPFDDGSVFAEHRWPSAKALTVVNRYENPSDPSKPLYRKVQCNHCLEPACASACPIHAYTKTPEGAVIYNEDLCFGCRYCVIACPFNMPGYDYDSAADPKIVKCILCQGRIKEGKSPACADACPGGALTFGRREDLIKLARRRIAEKPGRYIDHIYGEHEVGGTAWLYISGVPFEHLGFPVDLPKKPLISLTEGYLSTVPVIFTTFPAIFGLLYAATHKRGQSGHDDEKDDKQGEVHHE